MPSSQLSNIPWRKEGIRYANNEAYFDCIEELDAIIDKNGSVITCEVQGYVRKINGSFLKIFPV
jgi:AP-3 complex subunit mu